MNGTYTPKFSKFFHALLAEHIAQKRVIAYFNKYSEHSKPLIEAAFSAHDNVEQLISEGYLSSPEIKPQTAGYIKRALHSIRKGFK